MLVRFGEIGIKSPYVRRSMLQRLRRNILEAMAAHGVEGDVASIGSRLWLEGPDPDRLLGVATRTFGVVSASLAVRVPATQQELVQAAVGLGIQGAWRTFAVRATREGEHPFTSMELAKAAGSAIVLAREAQGLPCKVDLTQPEMEVHLDVRAKEGYAFAGAVAGPGGLPVGSQGVVVARVEDPRDALAAWLLMRRGCAARLASSRPDAEGHPARALRAWGWTSDLHAWGDPAAMLAQARASALVTGDGLQAAVLASDGPTVVLRPLAGLDPAFAADLARRHGLGELA